MQELEKILEEIIEQLKAEGCIIDNDAGHRAVDIIRKHTNDGWMPDNRRSNYEVTFINECGYEEHGFSQWYDGEFHIPAVVIAWREH